MNDGTKTGLALDNHIRHTHLAAKSRQEHDELNRVNVMGNDDKGSLLGLNKSNNVVQAVLDKEGLLRILEQTSVHIEEIKEAGRYTNLDLLVLGSSSSSSLETSLLLLLRLRAVLVQEFEQLSRSVLVQGVGELGNRRGNLKALVKDDLLALKTDVFGPLDKASEVSGGADVLAYITV